MSPLVRTVVLGNGFASRAQLPALKWAGGAEVVGLAGADPERAEATRAAWRLPLVTTDWRELLALDPDLVLITTPVHLHAEMAHAFLAETRAAVLCEKPFALDAEEAAGLVAAARGRAAWLDHELRWSPCRRRVRELLREGALGEVSLLRETLHYRNAGFAERPFGWWFQRSCGGGALGALGSHLVDHARWQLGEVESVACRLETLVPERRDADGTLRTCDADESAELELVLRSGARVELRTSVAGPGEHVWELEVVGARGRLRMDRDERLVLEQDGLGPRDVTPVPGLPTGASLGMPVEDPFPRCLPLYLRDVVRTVAAGGTVLAEATDFADALVTQRILDAALASSRQASTPIRL